MMRGFCSGFATFARARDLMWTLMGRVESTGCVTSGRRWHRRIPPFVAHDSAWPIRIADCRLQIADLGLIMAQRLFAVVALAVTLSGCAVSLHNLDIADLQRHPGRYTDRTVSVSGVVTSSWGVPLLPFRFYKVDDGTGEVTVLSESARMPATGERVRVKGRVQEVAVLGGRPLGLHLREQDIYFKR
jgi:hypothetical protein